MGQTLAFHLSQGSVTLTFLDQRLKCNAFYSVWWWWFSLQVMSDFCDPMDWACQAPLSMGVSRSELWSGLPFPSPEDLPNPGIELRSPLFQADSLLTEPFCVWFSKLSRWQLVFLSWVEPRISPQCTERKLIVLVKNLTEQELKIQENNAFCPRSPHFTLVLYLNF